MRDEMKATREEMRRIWRGLAYHCNELMTFMTEHGSDKWFETDEGKEMMNYAMKLTLSHISGLLKIDGDSFGVKDDGLVNAFDYLFTKSFKEV